MKLAEKETVSFMMDDGDFLAEERVHEAPVPKAKDKAKDKKAE